MKSGLARTLLAAGVGVGLLNVVFYCGISPPLLGQPTGLSVGGPLMMTFSWLEERLAGSNRVWTGVPPVLWLLVPGIVLGAMASAVLGGRLTWAAFRKARLSGSQVVASLTGGLLVGFGVLLADGCLVKHALTGLPGLSLESASVVAGILLGVWGAMKVQERFES